MASSLRNKYADTFVTVVPNFVNKSAAKPKVTVVLVALPFQIMQSHTLKMERVGMLYLPWRAHTITFLKTRVTHTHTTKHTHTSVLKNISRHTAPVRKCGAHDVGSELDMLLCRLFM